MSSCPEGALRVKPGKNSLKNALKKAKENDINGIFLENGVHDEFGEYVVIDFPVTIIGESKEGCRRYHYRWFGYERKETKRCERQKFKNQSIER